MPRVFQQEPSRPLARTLQSKLCRLWSSFALWRGAKSTGVAVEYATKPAETREGRKRMLGE